MFQKAVTPVVFLSVLAAAAATGLYGQQKQAVAHVLDVSGAWHLNGGTEPLKAGQGLNAGDRIAATAPHSGDSVTLLHDDDMSRQRVACDGTANDPCRNPIAIADPQSGRTSAAGQVKGMLQAALAVLLEKPPAISSHYAMTLSRGTGSVRELEAVAALDPDQGVAPPPPPQDMPTGTYTFSVARAGDASSATDKTVALTSEGTWRPFSMDAPGLYEVTIRNADEKKVADLMLLVTSPAEYGQKRDGFEALSKVADTWTGPDADTDKHLLLRAFLVSESQ